MASNKIKDLSRIDGSTKINYLKEDMVFAVNNSDSRYSDFLLSKVSNGKFICCSAWIEDGWIDLRCSEVPNEKTQYLIIDIDKVKDLGISDAYKLIIDKYYEPYMDLSSSFDGAGFFDVADSNEAIENFDYETYKLEQEQEQEME